MTKIFNRNDLVRGDHEYDIKFGSVVAGTSFVPVATGGVYRTPQVADATTLRVKAGGNALDTAAGTGARSITLEGLDATGARVSDTITTAGASASASTTQAFLRVSRAYVASSGSYATASAGSHAGDIVIEDTAGTQDWATLSATGFASGQSEIAVKTVPLGYTMYITHVTLGSDASKSSDVILFKRENILETAVPYTAMREQFKQTGLAGTQSLNPDVPFGPFPELTDVGWLAKVSTGTGTISAKFSYVLIENE